MGGGDNCVVNTLRRRHIDCVGSKEVSRMKTWLRQTDQAHLDDSGGAPTTDRIRRRLEAAW